MALFAFCLLRLPCHPRVLKISAELSQSTSSSVPKAAAVLAVHRRTLPSLTHTAILFELRRLPSAAPIHTPVSQVFWQHVRELWCELQHVCCDFRRDTSTQHYLARPQKTPCRLRIRALKKMLPVSSNRPPRTMDFGRNIIEVELILHPNG